VPQIGCRGKDNPAPTSSISSPPRRPISHPRRCIIGRAGSRASWSLCGRLTMPPQPIVGVLGHVRLVVALLRNTRSARSTPKRPAPQIVGAFGITGWQVLNYNLLAHVVLHRCLNAVPLERRVCGHFIRPSSQMSPRGRPSSQRQFAPWPEQTPQPCARASSKAPSPSAWRASRPSASSVRPARSLRPPTGSSRPPEADQGAGKGPRPADDQARDQPVAGAGPRPGRDRLRVSAAKRP
jgi:hypothetical protein